MEKYIDVESLKTLWELRYAFLIIIIIIVYLRSLERRFFNWIDNWLDRRAYDRERREDAYDDLREILYQTKGLNQAFATELKLIFERIRSVERIVNTLEESLLNSRPADFKSYDAVRNEIEELNNKVAAFEEQTKKDSSFKRVADVIDEIRARLDDALDRLDALESRNNR